MTARRRWFTPGRVALGLVLIGLAILLVNFQLHAIDGVSMEPGYADGSWIIVRRDSAPPHRHESVVMRSSGSEAKTVIKRAVAFGGESVLIREGDLLIDGKAMPRTPAQVRATLVPWLALSDLASRGRGRRKTLVGKTEDPVIKPLSGRCELSESGHYLRISSDEGAARIRIPVADIRNDHLSPKGRWVRGEEIVRDIELSLRFYEIAVGTVVQISHYFEAGETKPRERLRLERRPDAWHFRLEEESGRIVHESWRELEVRAPIRLTWIDDRCRLELGSGQNQDSWDTLFEGERLREGSAKTSYLTVEVEGDSVVLERLDILRDIHYTSPQTDAAYGVREPFEVPRGQVFVLGDNSPESRDSRQWGALEIADSVLGRPVFTIWPKDRWGFIRSAGED